MRSRVPGRRIDQLETGTLRWTSGQLVSWLDFLFFKPA